MVPTVYKIYLKKLYIFITWEHNITIPFHIKIIYANTKFSLKIVLTSMEFKIARNCISV